MKLKDNLGYINLTLVSIFTLSLATFTSRSFLSSIFGMLAIVFVSHAMTIGLQWLRKILIEDRYQKYISSKEKRITYISVKTITCTAFVVTLYMIGLIGFRLIDPTFQSRGYEKLFTTLIGLIIYLIVFAVILQGFKLSEKRIDYLIDWINNGSKPKM